MRLQEIRERLNKISRTPWTYNYQMSYEGTWVKIRRIEGPSITSNFTDDTPEGQLANSDCEFIVNAPDDLEYLLNRIQRYEAALKDIMHKGKFIDTVEECCYIAEEALKEDINPIG